MLVMFNEDYLENLYTKGETGTKKIRFQPQIVSWKDKIVELSKGNQISDSSKTERGFVPFQVSAF